MKIKVKEFICLYCKKKLLLWPSEVDGYKTKSPRKYCSKSCATSDRNKKGIIKPQVGRLGTHLSEKIKKKISKSKKKNPVKYWLNKQRPEMRKEIKSDWRNQRKQLRERTEYQQWIRNIYQRDNWTCQNCNKRGVYLNAHHIKPAKKFPDLILEVSNGITLCKNCHYKIHSNVR